MTIKQKIVSIFMSLTLIVCMGFSLAYGIINRLKLTSNPIEVAGIIFLCSILCMCLFFNKYTTGITLLSVVVGLGVSAVYLNIYQFSIDFVTWIRQFVQKEALDNELYRSILVVLICMLVVLVVYSLTVKGSKLFTLLIIGSSFYILQIIKHRPIDSLAFNLFILASLFYYFHYYYLKLQRTIEETEGVSQNSYIKLAVPLSLVIFLCTFILAHVVPLKLSLLHSMFDVKNSIAKPYDHMQDFPYKSQLGGDIILGDRPILEVISPRRIYLKAATKSIYTGYSWTNKKQEETNIFKTNEDRLVDTFETMWASTLLSKAPMSELFNKDSLKITFDNAQTKSLFMPAKSEKIILPEKITNVYLKYDDLLYLNKPRGKGFTYELMCYTPKYKSEKLEEALRKSKTGFYANYKAQMNPIVAGYTEENVEKNINKLIQRATYIQSDYTVLPSTLPQRVKDIAVFITKDYITPYDKARAIEAYLAGNYNYTLTPGEIRQNKDFVDEFLFENKKGYCTYFATSMAVLTRCIGLPSRYVEGYTMPNSYKLDTDCYTITDKQAHAWVEVYFEGFGWMMFEPTSSYQSSFRQNLSTAMDNYYHRPIQDSTFKYEDDLSKDRELSIGRKTVLLILKVALGMFMVLGILGVAAKYSYKKLRFKHMQPRLAILYLYQVYLKKLSQKNIVIEEGETPGIYAQKVDKLLGLECACFEEITQLFLIARYSDLTITEEEKEKMKNLYKPFLRQLKTYKVK